jgi:hypothetical protein
MTFDTIIFTKSVFFIISALEVWAGAAARQPPLGCTIGGITEMDKMKK